MNSEVKNCIDLKFAIFEQYFEVPPDVAEEISIFRERVEMMGEDCTDAVAFENNFASMGYQDDYNAFFARCNPKATKMTAEQKKESRKIFNEIAFGSNDKKVVAGKIATMVAKDAGSIAMMELESDARQMTRDRMIEEGTFDDYARAHSKVTHAKRAAGILGKLLGKK